MAHDNNILDAEVVVPLKYDLLLINCETKLDLSCSKECITSQISITPQIPGNPNANPPAPAIAIIKTTSATFQINNAKLYVPVATLSINENISFLENIKQGFKGKNSWNKYRSEIAAETNKL